MLLRPQDCKKFLEKNGYVILRNAVPLELLRQLIYRIDHLQLLPGDDGLPSLRYKHVFNRDPWWLSLIDLPKVMNVVEHVLGDTCHIIGNTAWKSVPGHLGSPCHIDYVPHPLTPEQSERFTWPCFILTAHIFPHSLTEELGPTRVIPGSHQLGGRYPEGFDGNYWAPPGYVSVFPSPGSVLLFRSDLLHGGQPNRTIDQNRYLLQVHYSQRWIAQRFGGPSWQWNQATLAASTPQQLRLLGKHPRSNYD